MKRALRWLARALAGVGLVLLTILFVYAFQARRLMDLQPWQSDPPADLTAGEMGEDFSLAQYLQRESALFAQTRQHLTRSTPADQRIAGNRYWVDSPNSQWNFRRDWNRTYELEPVQLRGGALLLHGLTDSPYTMRALARALQAQGYYVLVLRLPGHGLLPAGLAEVRLADWNAATRLGARAVRARIGPGKPLVMVGYSNGAALVLMHQLDALETPTLPRADRIVLLSPMIGLTPAAGMSRFLGRLSFIPFFRKSGWTEVQPEFNPFKYNSFPLNAAQQSYQLTRDIARSLARLQGDSRLARMPPILAYQSLLDSTVSTPAVVHVLFDKLPANGSELVLFDVNQAAILRSLVTPADRGLLATLVARRGQSYRLTMVGNATAGSRAVVARSIAPGRRDITQAPIGLDYPADVFSLSHIALPFRCDDPVYGLQPDLREDFGVRLGSLAVHGERGALVVPIDLLARIGCNPLYPYVEAHLLTWLAPLGASAPVPVPAASPSP